MSDEQLLKEAMEYMKIEEDDDISLNLVFEAAKNTVKGAIGIFDAENPQMRLLLYMVMIQFYDNRSLLAKNNQEKMSGIVRSLVMQLQIDTWEDEDGEETS